MYAVIRTGGKQYKVEPGAVLLVEKLIGEPGEEVSFDEVLLVKGEDVKVGRPLLEGAGVSAEIVAQERGEKLTIFKKKRRQGYSLKKGHRQAYTRVKIKEVSA